MAEKRDANGVYVEVTEEEKKQEEEEERKGSDRETLPEVLNRIAHAILFPEPSNSGSLLRRIKTSVAENAPLLPEASRNSARDVLLWTRRGSPFRAILVISVSAFKTKIKFKIELFHFVDSDSVMGT